MNHKAYSLALTTLALLCMPVPFFSFRPTVAPLSLWLFMLAKIGLEMFPSWSNDGFASVMGLIICATIAVQILIWGVIILVICRRLIRWTSNIQRSMTRRMVRVSLLCLPVALSTAPLFQMEEEAPQSPWQALWGEFRRKMDWDNYSGAMAGLPSSARELAMQGRYVEAEPLYRRILELGRKHERIQTGAEKYSTAEQLECLAWILHAQGRHTESESTLGEAVAIMKRQWVGSDRNSLRYYQDYLVKLAELLSMHGKHDQAEGILRKVLEENKKHAIENNQHWARENRSQPLSPIDAEVARALDHLAEELWRQGNYAGAEALSRESLTMLAALEAADEFGSKSDGLAHLDALITLACVLRDQQQYAEADLVFERLLTRNPNALRSDMLAESWSGFAESLRRQGEFAKALPLAERALEFREKWALAGHPALADSLDTLAGIHAGLGNTKDAELFAARAIAIRGQQP